MDSWVTTSIGSAPAERSDHTAVWTGSEMIAWGGYNGVSSLNSGGRYSPSTDSWVATSTDGTPAARSLHTTVWTGGGMIVWGGYYSDGSRNQYLNCDGRYSPS